MEAIKLINGDCMDVIEGLDPGSINAIVTDPPYPDYYVKEYGTVDLNFLDQFKCRQLIFWSAKSEFPLSYSGIHIWDKKTGVGSEYERIFERNGHKDYKIYHQISINNRLRTMWAKDHSWDHPSQKPIRLMVELVERITEKGDTVLDPFMGSGSTGAACQILGRRFIGIEKNDEYFNVAERRLNMPYQERMI